MTVYECCRQSVICAPPQTSVREVAQLMTDSNVGCVVITDDDHKPVGVVTDRDLVLRVLAGDRNPKSTQAGQVMSRSPVVVVDGTGLFEAMQCARENRIRRLPVVDGDGKLVGIITLDDIVRLLAEEMRCINEVILESSPEA